MSTDEETKGGGDLVRRRSTKRERFKRSEIGEIEEGRPKSKAKTNRLELSCWKEFVLFVKVNFGSKLLLLILLFRLFVFFFFLFFLLTLELTIEKLYSAAKNPKERGTRGEGEKGKRDGESQGTFNRTICKKVKRIPARPARGGAGGRRERGRERESKGEKGWEREVGNDQ